ncbi:hypothetical protein HYU06_02680 [Candidatus Woesearchaeota archaeon]|nr:hypothetical protein [Candidatus Woesearchaeota archaeon]
MEEHEINTTFFWKRFQNVFLFLRNPLNLAFLVVLGLGIAIRWKYLFIESLWTDESAYVLYGSRLTSNPLYIFDAAFKSNGIYIPEILIGFFMIKQFVYFLNFCCRNLILLSMFFSLSHRYEKTGKGIIPLIAALLFALLTKPQAYILIPILALYYILRFTLTEDRKELKHFVRKKIFYAVLCLVALFLLWQGHYIYRNIFANLTLYFDFVNILPYMVSWTIIVLFLIGTLFALIYRKKEHLLMLSWLIVGYGVFLVYRTLVQPRYILPVLPVIFLLALIGIYEALYYIRLLGKINIPKFIPLLLIAFVAYGYYTLGDSIAMQKAFTYTGYEEAGEFLRQNVDASKSIVLVGSTSPSTLYTGIEFHSQGGVMYGSPEFKDLNELMDFINNNSTAAYFYLQLSIWEYGDYWAFPITQELVNNIISKGFELVKVVEREIATEKGLQKAPVFLIFKYSKTTNSVKTEALNASTIS